MVQPQNTVTEEASKEVAEVGLESSVGGVGDSYDGSQA